MSYYTGSVTPVPNANRQAYIDHATRAWPIMREHGATRMVETWGEDVQRGKWTDFHRAVDAKEGESIVFAWLEWPDRASSDAAFRKMMDDPSFSEKLGEIPFDGKRMIWGGFSPVFEGGTDKGAGYMQGFLTPVPKDNREAFAKLAREAYDSMFAPNGCLGSYECWGEEVPHGKQTDMYRATDAKDGETVAFSWTAWPDRATCDAAGKAMEASMEGKPMPEMPFDGKRMIWGGFSVIFDSDKA